VAKTDYDPVNKLVAGRIIMKTLTGFMVLPSVFAAFATPALAADMPLKAPPQVAAPYSWSGIYIGGNIGAGFGKADVDASGLPVGGDVVANNPLPVGPDSFDIPLDSLSSSFSQTSNPNGLIGGAQIGFNVQSGRFVFGVEADFQGSLQKDRNSRSDAFNDGFNVTVFPLPGPDITLNGEIDRTLNTEYRTGIDWFGTVRGRFGIAEDNLLVYATGGLAYGRVKIDGSTSTDGTGSVNICYSPLGCAEIVSLPFNPNASSFGGSKTNYGWTLGGGMEWAATSNLSFKAEYLYMDLGSIDVTGTSPSGDDYSIHAKFTNHIARVGFNYKLGSPY
jgi:outer membrane immunogenic protein